MVRSSVVRATTNKAPVENSQVGVRLGATTPQGLTFTLNYLYQRLSQDDGWTRPLSRVAISVSLAPLVVIRRSVWRLQNTLLIERGILPAEAYYPYVHTLGISASYADSNYTEGVADGNDL